MQKVQGERSLLGLGWYCGQTEVDVQNLRHVLEVESIEIADGLDLRARKKGIMICLWLRLLDRYWSLHEL